MIYSLIAVSFAAVVLAVVVSVLNKKNKQLKLKVDAAEYNFVVASGKLTALTLDTYEKDLEVETLRNECDNLRNELKKCKRVRDAKGRYIKK